MKPTTRLLLVVYILLQLVVMTFLLTQPPAVKYVPVPAATPLRPCQHEVTI